MFDPYHKWLGIPPSEQPPHHYRLLGISLYESDPEVIEASAERQMHHVGRCASGSHLSLVPRFHRELSAARDCLLAATTKRAYDDELKSRLGQAGDAAESPETQSPAIRIDPGVSCQHATGGNVDFDAPPLLTMRRKRPRDATMFQLVIGAVLGGVIAWAGYFGLGRPQLQIRHTEQHLTVEVVRTNHPPVRWSVW